ncbi:hypothetical protein CXB51_017454 [Gossypium anomalum]|uniref:BED-type domain-containing protein n=1 Tax=Gossypium anomalum TaxID=47600 RepID=A0A8J6D0Z4_9ROSI|nr:hypothetical protein CXB51_017454 [Gossypium anomalum]
MSYNSEQCHHSYSCTGSSLPMTVIEGNDISNARDTTHERPTLEESKSLDDIEVATYTRRNSKKTSITWQELAVVKLADGTKKVQCNHCKIKFSKNRDGTTTKNKRHLMLSLKGQDNLFLVPQAPRSDNASAKIKEVVSNMIMVHELPFAFTEYELFTLLIKTVNPHYVRISRAIVKANCWTSYEVEKKIGQKSQYMVLTAHFVDSDWNLQKSIEGKMCSISVDNASYNDTAVRMLKDSLSFHKSLPLNGKLIHVRFCAHILNQCEIEDVIYNLRETVKHIIASTVCLTTFSDIVKQLQLPNKRLILDCCTQWNATYAMLSCVLEFKDIFSYYQHYQGKCNLLISIAAIPDLGSKMKLIDFSFCVNYSKEEALRQICIVYDSLYELYKEYVDEYTSTNVGISMENDVQESGVSNASTTSRIGKGKVMMRDTLGVLTQLTMMWYH